MRTFILHAFTGLFVMKKLLPVAKGRGQMCVEASHANGATDFTKFFFESSNFKDKIKVEKRFIGL